MSEFRYTKGLLLVVSLLLAVAGYGYGVPPQEPPAGIITPDHSVAGDGVPTVLFFMGIAEDELQADISMDKWAYVLGETGVIYFNINQPAYIYVWTVCPTAQRIVQLFPSTNDPNNHFQAGHNTIPTPGSRYRLQAGPPEGWKWMQIMALSSPLPGVDAYAHIPFPPLDLSPADWSQQFLSWLAERLPPRAEQAFNFTSYQIVGTPVVQHGTLRVTSNPPGAQVFVNGTPKGVIPQWQPLDIPLAPGSYTVSVRLSGFHDYTTTVQIVAGGVQEVRADLMGGVVGQGNLRIVSVPPGLGVYIGGTFRGTTPVDIPLPAGIHSVQLLSGAIPVWSRNVVVVPFLTQTITVTIGDQPAPTGASIATDKHNYSVGEQVVFTLVSSTACTASVRVEKPDGSWWVVNLGYLAAGLSRTFSPGAEGLPVGSRTATLYCSTTAVASTTYSVGAPLQCTYAISPTSHAFPNAGGSLSVNVSAPAGCPWTATSPHSWITVSPSSGSGMGAVTVSATPHPLGG